MKTNSYLSAILIAISILCVTSCEKADDGVRQDVNFNETTAQAYVRICDDMFKTITQDVVQIVKNDEDIDGYLKNFYDSYFDNLSLSDKKLLNNNYLGTLVTRSGDGLEELNLLTNGVFDRFKPLLIEGDVNMLYDEMSLFYNEPYFQGLSADAQTILIVQLETLKNARDNMIDFVIALRNNQEMTRMSPGDRMVWREAAAQMTDAQREKFFAFHYLGISLALTCAFPGTAIYFWISDVIVAAWAFAEAE